MIAFINVIDMKKSIVLHRTLKSFDFIEIELK